VQRFSRMAANDLAAWFRKTRLGDPEQPVLCGPERFFRGGTAARGISHERRPNTRRWILSARRAHAEVAEERRSHPFAPLRLCVRSLRFPAGSFASRAG